MITKTNLPVVGELFAKESLTSNSGMIDKKYQMGISISSQPHNIRAPAEECRSKLVQFQCNSKGIITKDGDQLLVNEIFDIV